MKSSILFIFVCVLPISQCQNESVSVSSVSIANRGVYDLEAHINSQKHKKFLQGECSTKLTGFFTSGTKNDDSVAASERTLASHRVMHCSSFNALSFTFSLTKATVKKLAMWETKTGTTG